MDQVRWGFEFTIPVSLGRYFGARITPEPVTQTAQTTGYTPYSTPDVVATIRNLAFTPARIEVEVGTTIEWRNEDQVDHTVTAIQGAWDSGIIAPGTTWQRTFDTPGTFEFICTPHPFMKGVIVVRPAS